MAYDIPMQMVPEIELQANGGVELANARNVSWHTLLQL
jgi:hypothetical protein